MPQQEITSNEIFGIAKKFNAELEALPMHTHSAICEMVRVGMQHRNLQMQAANQQEQKDLQDRQLRLQEQHMKMQTDAANKAAVDRLGPIPIAPN